MIRMGLLVSNGAVDEEIYRKANHPTIHPLKSGVVLEPHHCETLTATKMWLVRITNEITRKGYIANRVIRRGGLWVVE